ncbi:MAG: DNA polymerase III subunit delta [Verrucomicrobiota bacterium]|jgi:DNA polymerase-3 subunit delta
MPAAAAPDSPVLLICGEDEFAVKQRAREVFQQWGRKAGGVDAETIDASVNNSGEALRSLAQLREALQTLPFFGGSKVVWLQNCNFLGEERSAAARDVTDALASLARELKTFRWESVRLLVSSGKVDKRKAFYKALEQIGRVETFPGWAAEDKEWAAQAEDFARCSLSALDKEISDEALAQLVASVGPHIRMLSSEVEKLALYAGSRPRLGAGDVEAIVTRNKQARSFALGDAVGDRNLVAVLRCLDRELWEIKRDSKRNEIGLLYGIVGKVRALVLVKEMLAQKWLRPGQDFARFKSQLDRVPADAMPEERQFNPLAWNPFAVFKSAGQAANYTLAELIQAMDLLLQCNQKLISRNLDPSLLLQQTLVQIVSRPDSAPLRAAA